MEYRVKCNVCGEVFCYTDQDIAKNKSASTMEALSAIGSIAGALSGNWVAARANQAEVHNQERKIIDFEHCPHCRSTNLHFMTDEEWNDYRQSQSIASGAGFSINSNATVETLKKRVELFLEQKEWTKADLYCEQALDMEPENGELYFLKLLADKKVANFIELKAYKDICDHKYFSLAKKYGNADVQEKIVKLEYELKKIEYENLISSIDENRSSLELAKTALALKSMIPFEDAEKYYHECDELCTRKKEEERQATLQSYYTDLNNARTIEEVEAANEKILEISTDSEKTYSQKAYLNKKEEIEKAIGKSEKQRKGVLVALGIISAILVLAFTVIIPLVQFNVGFAEAKSLYSSGDYKGADNALDKLSITGINQYRKAEVSYMRGLCNEATGISGYSHAINYFLEAGNYSDAQEKAKALSYAYGINYWDKGDFYGSQTWFEKADGYKDSGEYLSKTEDLVLMDKATNKFSFNEYNEGYELLNQVSVLKDEAEKIRAFYKTYEKYTGDWVVVSHEYKDELWTSGKWYKDDIDLNDTRHEGTENITFKVNVNIGVGEPEECFTLYWGDCDNEKDREINGSIENNVFTMIPKDSQNPKKLTFNLETGELLFEDPTGFAECDKYKYKKK